MATDVPGAGAARAPAAGARRVPMREARATETSPAYRTTELVAYLAAAAAVVIAGAVADDFGAQDIWLYVTILTVGYMVSRGLAKSGCYEGERGLDRDVE
jgi:hypothetical protein